MENVVLVKFESQMVYVNKKGLRFSFTRELLKNVPSEIDINQIEEVWWNVDGDNCLMLNGTPSSIDFGEEHYDDYVKPYVDLWYAEKDRLEQEQAEAEAEYAKFENRKERALNTIQADYENALASGFVRTSMKFDADISVESSATLSGTNISLAYMATLGTEAPTTTFRDFYGLKRELDQSKVATLICQINEAQNHIREQKYTFKDMVKGTYDNDSLNEVIAKCIYTTLDFTGDEVTEIPFTQAKTIQERIDRW